MDLRVTFLRVTFLRVTFLRVTFKIIPTLSFLFVSTSPTWRKNDHRKSNENGEGQRSQIC